MAGKLAVGPPHSLASTDGPPRFPAFLPQEPPCRGQRRRCPEPWGHAGVAACFGYVLWYLFTARDGFVELSWSLGPPHASPSAGRCREKERIGQRGPPSQRNGCITWQGTAPTVSRMVWKVGQREVVGEMGFLGRQIGCGASPFPGIHRRTAQISSFSAPGGRRPKEVMPRTLALGACWCCRLLWICSLVSIHCQGWFC